MKAVLYLPAHPSYLEGGYSQAEIDAAIKDYDLAHAGFITGGRPVRKVPEEFRLLREPGQSVCVILESDGLEVPEDMQPALVNQFEGNAAIELRVHMACILNRLAVNRACRACGT